MCILLHVPFIVEKFSVCTYLLCTFQNAKGYTAPRSESKWRERMKKKNSYKKKTVSLTILFYFSILEIYSLIPLLVVHVCIIIYCWMKKLTENASFFSSFFLNSAFNSEMSKNEVLKQQHIKMNRLRMEMIQCTHTHICWSKLNHYKFEFPFDQWKKIEEA